MKYTALETYLAGQQKKRIPMSFDEVEAIVGSQLPRSARKYRPWWGNNAAGHVHAQAWLNAGYQTEDVEMDKERLVFVRQTDDAESPAGSSTSTSLFGALRGLIHIAPGVSLCEPTGEIWDAGSDRR